MERSCARLLHVLARVIVVALAATATQLVVAQSGAKNGEWPTYGGDLGHTRYSPLDQINAANFSHARGRVALQDRQPRSAARVQSRRHAADGQGRALLDRRIAPRRRGARRRHRRAAVDAQRERRQARRSRAAPAVRPRAGLLDRRPRGANPLRHARLSARRARREDRRADPGFGKNGIVDLKLENDQADRSRSPAKSGCTRRPSSPKNVVIVGAAHRSGGVPRSKTNVKGYVRGFDVRTGKRLWIFHTIPRRASSATTPGKRIRGRTPATPASWGQISRRRGAGPRLSADRGADGRLLRRPPAGQRTVRRVAGRGGSETGKRKWHYQLVHHGIWDNDIPCAPILADITVNGRTVKAVAQPTKQAFLFVFDRETGEPIWPIEERPVPKGDVPGEWYSPTQPFPTKPPRLRSPGIVDGRSDRLHAGAAR